MDGDELGARLAEQIDLQAEQTDPLGSDAERILRLERAMRFLVERLSGGALAAHEVSQLLTALRKPDRP